MITVFTPTHDAKFLNDCHRSLDAQTHTDWEWVVVPNGGAALPDPLLQDPRVRIVPAPEGMTGVGAVKRFACGQADGDILVELDHDDWLLPHALDEIQKAFDARPDVALVYSDFSYIETDGTPSPFKYEGRWNYSSEEVYGKMYHRCHAQAPTPENVAVIWYAPNHVRAFARWAYEKAGGYDADYEILDDQDLMTRLYLVGDFHHIDQLLYLQRMHADNTQFAGARNAEIQRRTVEIYRDRIQEMIDAWSERELAKRA